MFYWIVTFICKYSCVDVHRNHSQSGQGLFVGLDGQGLVYAFGSQRMELDHMYSNVLENPENGARICGCYTNKLKMPALFMIY